MARDYWGNVMDVVGSGLMDTYKVQQDTVAKKAQAIRDAEKAKQERQRMQIDLGAAADQSRVTESNLQSAEMNRNQTNLENQRFEKKSLLESQTREAKNLADTEKAETTKKAVLAAMTHVDSDKAFSASSYGKAAKAALLNNDLNGYYDSVGKYETDKNKLELEGMKNKGTERQQAYADKNVLQTLKLDTKESERISAVYEAKDMLNSLVTDYKAKGFGGAGQLPAETVSKIPLIGKYIAPESKEYQNTKRRVSETYLRAATGAAAPAKEVETYMNFLPDQSDPLEVGQKKLDIFKTKILTEAKSRTNIIRQEGKALLTAGNEKMGNAKMIFADSLDKSLNEAMAGIDSLVNKSQNTQSEFDTLWGE